ncbi:MAG TPA: peptide ABC transporter substrate-binding protein [Candidatus Saccharibacteria bacterium]|nr:peptide ABC transporter substrate-binding protein [Candidatus Saccharibacteria bacterium]
MVNRASRLRFRRNIKRRKSSVEVASKNVEKNLDKLFFRRLNKFFSVRRFVVGWILLLALLGTGVIIQSRALSGFYQDLVPVAGGTYVEGQAGRFTNANPIYASSPVDKTVSKLVFSSLMQFDRDNELVGDVAKSMKADKSATKYTLKLRDDVYWHDGHKLTSKDVIFTFNTIQNADAQSPLRSIWQKVKITAKGDYEVLITLPHSLSSFPQSLTTGLIPEHLLNNIPPSRLRSVAFNTSSPVGSGPFKWKTIEVTGDKPENRQEQIGLARNAGYYKGPPLIEKFIIRSFHNNDDLLNSYKGNELTAVVGIDKVDEGKTTNDSSQEFNLPLMAQVSVFLKNSNDILKDEKVRQAMVHATDTNAAIERLGYPVVKSDNIILKNHIGYNPKITQREYDLKAANKLLDKAGWKKRNNEGVRVKAGKELNFRLYSKDIPDYQVVAEELQNQWKKIGVRLDVILQSDEDLQSVIAFHNYDILLYGISLGNDPDVYAYWHSSQADATSSSRLNFSEYKSEIVDQALEGGRSRTDPRVRVIKYQPMLTEYSTDAPAIALYQPRLLYRTNRQVFNFHHGMIPTSTDRFSNVEAWAIRQELVNKP